MTSALFFGSPAPAVPSLAAVADTLDLVGVVTRPPTRRGRGRMTRPTPIAEAAIGLGVPVHTPGAKAELHDLPLDVDIAVVVAFGMLIPAQVLVRPRLGFLNVHFSLLPRWRGAAPVERAILAGDSESGVCLMQMDEGLDTGPVFTCAAVSIGGDTAGALTERLAAEGAALLRRALPDIVEGRLVASPQEGDPTHAAKLTREEAMLDLTAPTEALLRRIRAFTPRPGASVATDDGPVKIWEADPSGARLSPGEWRHEGDRVLLGTGDGALRVRVLQAPGGRRMDAAAWANGRRGAFPTVE